MDRPADQLMKDLRSELERLGLTMEDLPAGGLAGDKSALQDWLARLRLAKPGVTWRDVLPDLPAHWVAGRPETWTVPYKPLGPYDYQELPTSPAVHVSWPEKENADRRLSSLLNAARAAGWPIHGAGLIPSSNPQWPTMDAMIVLERGTTEEELSDFTSWLETQSGIELCSIPRIGPEAGVATGYFVRKATSAPLSGETSAGDPDERG